MRVSRIPTALFAMILASMAVELVAQESATSLPAELGWVKFRISGGRLQIASPRYRESRTFESSNPLVGTSESLRLNIAADSASLQYRQESPQHVLTVEFESSDVVTISRLPGEEVEDDATMATVSFSQQSNGHVELSIDDGTSQPRTHRAANLWTLLILNRADAEEHLLPILATLRPGWPIAETVDDLEHSLVKFAHRSVRPQREHWDQWVEELGSPSFHTRRRAERMLRESGPAVVSYLTTIPRESLDAERKARIARLLSALSTSADDTPDRIAIWLIDDPLAWTSVLESDDVAHRKVAKEQLEALTSRNIVFDADADESTREVQVSAIRESLSPK